MRVSGGAEGLLPVSDLFRALQLGLKKPLHGMQEEKNRIYQQGEKVFGKIQQLYEYDCNTMNCKLSKGGPVRRKMCWMVYGLHFNKAVNKRKS